MRNNKGQALVEFALILPVILMLIFCLIDFGRVILSKNGLENTVSDVLLLYENGKTKDEIESIINENEKDEIKVLIDKKDDYITISVNKTIKPITPGLIHISEEVFDISSSRVIKNE